MNCKNNEREKMTLFDQIAAELENSKERIKSVEYGKITFIIQDGILMRIEITETRKAKIVN